MIIRISPDHRFGSAAQQRLYLPPNCNNLIPYNAPTISYQFLLLLLLLILGHHVLPPM